MNLINTIIILSLAAVNKVIGVQVCGRQLADMLDLVCDGRGFHWINADVLPSIAKRSALQYISAATASDSLQHTGVVTECCRKSCPISHMERYCAAPVGTNFPNPTSAPITEDVANDILESAHDHNSQTTQQPVQTTRRPMQQHSISRLPNLKSLLNSLSRTPFFFVRPVGPRPTRTPVVV